MGKKRNAKTGLGAFNLWQWGLIVIFGGLMAGLLAGFMFPGGSSAAARGQQLGAAAASILFILIGAVMIVVGLVRGNR